MRATKDPDSGGSQIFVTPPGDAAPRRRYTLFGQLRDGFDVLDAIRGPATRSRPFGLLAPKNPR